MKKIPLIVCFIFLTLIPAQVFSQRRPSGQITVKLASMVPANTPWGAALNRMASEWSAATNGEVRLQIYANGTQGTESDVLQKLNMNALQAAVLTSFGLNRITPEIMALSCPFLIRNDDELTEVLKTVQPEIEAKINAQGYYPLALVRGGWVRFFSKLPVLVPADLKRQKIGTDPQEPELAQVFKTIGYQTVPVEANRTLIALNGGTIEAIYQSPIAAGGFQYFGVAKNMASIYIAPFMGGIVINKRTWDRIPPQHRTRLIEITKRIEREIEASLRQLENDAITTMQRHGLTINQISPQQEELWYRDMEQAIPSLIGTTFDRSTYTRIEAILREYRNR
jgi:TRAP-type C4-dicarboxylate transport system substrate-binding protein